MASLIWLTPAWAFSGLVIKSKLALGTEDLFPQHVHRIHDADDDGVHRRVFHARRKAGAAALREQHHLAEARTQAVHRDYGVRTGTEFRRVLFIHELRAKQQ